MKTRIYLLAAALLTLSFSSCKLGRFVYYNFANITDHKIFPSREIAAPETAFVFPKGNPMREPKAAMVADKETDFDDMLANSRTVAFLIIQNDSIQYEKYFNKYDDESIVASFSMAKSILSILVGIAIDEGRINSVDEPIINYVPELEKNGFGEVTIKQLLQMTSGMKFNESYTNPFGDAATYYYGTNLRKALKNAKLDFAPGEKFSYRSGQTQLLGLVLERALKDQTISSYLEEKLWQPMGMEFDATWSLDRKKNGLEKTFCCLNARARDFAKIGRLYLNEGSWEGKQLVSKDWVKASTQLDTTENSRWFYQYQWWMPTKDGDFMAQGILGQYIYVNPDKNMIIVRLGEKEGNVDWTEYLPEIASKY